MRRVGAAYSAKYANWLRIYKVRMSARPLCQAAIESRGTPDGRLNETIAANTVTTAATRNASCMPNSKAAKT